MQNKILIVKIARESREFPYDDNTTVSDLKQAVKKFPVYPGDNACKLGFELYSSDAKESLNDDNRTISSYNLPNSAKVTFIVHAKGCCNGKEQYHKSLLYICAGLVTGLSMSAAHCIWKACSSSNLGTSFGERLLKNVSPKVCIGITAASTILGAIASRMDDDHVRVKV